MMKRMRWMKAMSALTLTMLLLTTCRIEPPLNLPHREVVATLPIVITDVDVVWNINVDWKADWWYGWDDEDVTMWGDLTYPIPTNFEVRRFYQGELPSETHELDDAFTVYGNRFRRRYNFGYYDLLLWSNIDSKDGTQSVVIDETDQDAVLATTTRAALGYQRAPNRVAPLKNQPDIFYNGYEQGFYISRDPLDYDYYDEAEDTWVKLLHTTLDPVVYIYLVQVVIYNNKGRIEGLNDNPTITNMAEGVNLNNGHTTLSNVDVTFGMRMKQNLPARSQRMADIIGGKFTTFGLCDMDSWQTSRGVQYVGSRADLKNNLLLDIRFYNASDAVFYYDVTKQIQSQAHGGVVTIEIDADTITVPKPDQSGGSGFKPVVEENDTVIYDFGI